jgi:hypothetical protein
MMAGRQKPSKSVPASGGRGDRRARFAGDDEFARAGHAAGVAELRIPRQQFFNTMDDVYGYALGGGRIIHGDVGAQ